MSAVLAATQFESLGFSLSRHRAVTRVSLAALSFTILIALSHQAPAKAGPEAAPVTPEPLLPQSVGVAIDTDGAITIPFDTAMDPASVETALQILPAQKVEMRWNTAQDRLTLVPGRLWRTDERYLVVVGGTSTNISGDAVTGARRFTFTTEAAPVVTEFQVALAPDAPTAEPGASPSLEEARASDLTVSAQEAARRDDLAATLRPARTATSVSASSSITIGFSQSMDRADVESRFAIAPEIEGELSWIAGNLTFTPSERLKAGMRYTISLAGAHDTQGNALGSTDRFSFVVQDGAQLTKTTPNRDAAEAETATVSMWFSQPMKVDATNKAFALVDTVTGQPTGGHLVWNEARTQITFTPDVPFAGGRTYRVVLAKGARDAFGNAVRADWAFTTRVVVGTVRSNVSTRSAPSIPAPAPATSLAGYALNQVNAARAAYGFAPLVLDAAISAVASSYAMDQASNGYFSHTGRDGSTREVRLARGGVGFGWSGENQCYHVGLNQQATLNWCHAQFMAEPYPGHWNHIGNILNPDARRMGIGIATVGGRTVITWDFTD
ncbi:MAG TPA: Ig-like domain-containing protein [Candidatus Limnocylindria bacterium]